ncbi:MAG: hypothetical protein ABIP03_13020, partial [Aquihabitans sp.]
MNETTHFTIGAEVGCTDGDCEDFVEHEVETDRRQVLDSPLVMSWVSPFRTTWPTRDAGMTRRAGRS